ncbi:EcsC family protein [Pseudomonas viridiflava]|uniref:EcsC family protein n=1 Tax=Pseudomonas viridiflava TaxID=33069 RepID=UPI000F01331A|nr:EcsC family protein [Pseudomonas viridiflava]MDY0936176.1 EcsC family protein [Pseudomonas viridiflava]MDY1014204.1 EcsC family protein [Pseudomonas viridiflava]MEE4222735.1 EcsC family protein [Pseudomonas viridiflava]
MSNLSKYEQHALKEIHNWKEPEVGWFGRAMRVINQPLDKAGDLLFNAPGVGPAIRGAIEGLTSVCHDAAQWSVRPEAIFEEFRGDGHSTIKTHKDILDLDLEQIDKVVGFLGAKYKGIALVEGAGAGVAGLPGLAIDIPALITLNLRAIGEYAAYYGFDTSRQEERLFAFNVLGLASSPTDGSKALAMAQLIKISQDVAKKATWQELEKSAFVKIIQEIAKALGIRLTKAKLAQAIPAIGAAVGGGFNAYFTMKVCDAAYYLYRERFLAQKYGVEIIEETVKPAKDYDPHYTEASDPL